MLQDNDDTAERDKLLYSFNHANQDQALVFGIDTSTEEGRAQFKAEYYALCELAPELVKKENLIFPHEMSPAISTEPHFRRVWQHYREHMFRLRFAALAESGEISAADAELSGRFLDLSGQPSFNVYVMGRLNLLEHLHSDEGYQATMRVMDTMGLGAIEFDMLTAMPTEEQFWEQFDGVFELSEAEMRAELPNIVTDPSNLAKVDALIEGHSAEAVDGSAGETRQLA